jgi:hypothetical protein
MKKKISGKTNTLRIFFVYNFKSLQKSFSLIYSLCQNLVIPNCKEMAQQMELHPFTSCLYILFYINTHFSWCIFHTKGQIIAPYGTYSVITVDSLHIRVVPVRFRSADSHTHSPEKNYKSVPLTSMEQTN